MKYYWNAKIRPLLGLLAFLFVIPHCALANGFLLDAESTSALGEALAGGSAIAEDASTNFYNPAGLVRFKRPQMVGSSQAFFLSENFKGTTSASYTTFGSQSVQTGATKATVFGLIPAFYYETPFVTDHLWLGFGMTVPAGLNYRYPPDSVLRYSLTHDKVQLVNINLNLGWKVTDKISVGGGLNVMRGDEINKVNVLNPFDPTSTDWNFEYNVNGYAYGVNLGVLYQPTPRTRIGLSYRTQSELTMNGKAITNTQGSFSSSASSPLTADNFSISFKAVPPLTLLSIYQELTPCWDIMGTIDLEQWSVFKNTLLKNVPIPTATPIEFRVLENFHDIVNFSIGTRYRITDKLRVKTGVGFSPSAVTTDNRDMEDPVTTSWVVTIGAHYQLTRKFGADFAYAHPFFKTANLQHQMNVNAANTFIPVTYTTSESAKARLLGNIIGAQFTYDFD